MTDREKRDRRAVELYQAGLTLRQVGRELGVSRTTVLALLRAQGVARRPKGFGGMRPEQQQEFARQGGQALHAQGTAHRFTSAEIRRGATMGARRLHELGVAHRFTHEQAVAAGRKGGLRRTK